MKKILISGLLVIAAFGAGLYLKDQLSTSWQNLFQRSEQQLLEPVITRFADEELSISEVVKKVGPSVVTISAEKSLPQVNNFGFSPFGFGAWFNLFEENNQQEIEKVEQDIGTGFVVLAEKNQKLLVITNRHVVENRNLKYLVYDSENTAHLVTNIYRDPNNDLAILEVENLNLPALSLGNSDEIQIGESVIAIGTALGEFRNTVTSGIISGVGRGIRPSDGFGRQKEELENIIQTDAAINPGNSGGPLINARGEVIGVNVAVSVGAENIGFALPINIIKSSIENFEITGEFDRAFLGISYALISEKAALLNEVPQGAYVQEVINDSNAERAGLKAGDIITKYDGKKITEKDNLAKLLNETKIGQEINVEIWRQGETLNLKVKLDKNN